MIKIQNDCPICEKSKLLFFKDSGDDFPGDGPWSLPCTECERKLIECDDNFFETFKGCLFGVFESIQTARKLIMVG